MTHPEPAARPSQESEPADLPIDPRDTVLPPAAAPAAQAPAPAPPVADWAAQPAMTAPTMQVPTVQPPAPQAAPAEAPGSPTQQAYPPASAPVVYPGAAYPVSSVPVSAYPVSAYPTSGYPTGNYAGGYPGGPAVAPKRPIATIVLSVTVGVLVLALGVLTTLFVLKSIELTDTRTELTGQVTERDDKIKLNTIEIENLKTQVQKVKDELAVANRDLEGSENAGKELQAAKAALADCLNKLDEYFASPNTARQNAANAACNAAEQYM